MSSPNLNLYFNTNYGFLGGQCKCSPPSLPLTKTLSSTTGTSSNSLNTSTNDTQISCRMRYSQQVQSYGTTQSSTSYAKKTCRIGGPTFSY